MLCQMKMDSEFFSSSEPPSPLRSHVKKNSLLSVAKSSVSPHIDHRQHVSSVYDQRRLQVQNTCLEYKSQTISQRTPAWKRYSNWRFQIPVYCSMGDCPLVVEEVHHLAFCLNLKVASTSVKHLLLRLANKTTSLSDFHEDANNLLYRVSTTFYTPDQLQKFFKVIFVRHPFVRLVSAFKDKTRDSDDSDYFYDAYWRPIMLHERGPENITQHSKPTFREFVRYLIATPYTRYNLHWTPYWLHCDVCSMNYDFIGKLETAQQDLEYVLKRIGSNETVYLMNYTGGTDYQETKSYFSTLPPNEVLELYKKLFLDFQMFNYTLEDVL